MAVQHPVARIIGHELHITRLGNSHEHRVSWSPCRFGLASSFRSRNYELMAVKVDRMVVHPQIDEADADALPVPHDKRSVGWTGFSVEGKPVKFHVHRVRDFNIRQDRVLLHDDDEILVDPGFVGFLRVHDERTDHPHHFLHRHVRVVEVGAFLVEGELVDESAAGCDGILARPRRSVHVIRYVETVPVHRRCFGKVVIHNDANAIAPGNLNGWPRSAAVVTPKIDDSARDNFLLHWLGNEMEFLYIPVHAPRQVGDVRRLDKNGRAVVMDRPFLAFHIHSGHVPGHLHLLGGKYFRGSEKSRSQHCRILKKSSSCPAHACLLEFSILRTAIFADESLGLVRNSFRMHSISPGEQPPRAWQGRPALSFSGGTAQIRRTPVDMGPELLRKSCGTLKWRLESGAPDADFSKSTARNLPACSLKRDSKEDAAPRGVEPKMIAGNSREPQFRKPRNNGASCGMVPLPWQCPAAAAPVCASPQF